MVFSSPVFLIVFLPLVLLTYFACPRAGRNMVLIAASLLFYAWGEKHYVALLAVMALGNWAAGLWIARAPHCGWRLTAAIMANLLVLGVFKYLNFIVGSLNSVFNTDVPALPVHLPAGISFITFQAISYLVDVRRGLTSAERSPGRYWLYTTLFPHLVAGPIVRYRDLAMTLGRRHHTFDDFAIGVQRFIIGLGKKVLLADTLRVVSDEIFQLSAGDRSMSVAWLGLFAFSLQIYFDFSGYSDMAIGLGRMFGFRFTENFRYPYVAASLTDFWRRWHMTLSGWLRDYVYVPMGGNRRRVVRNLLVTMALCGLWHGAAWTFFVWGVWHGIMLVVERQTGRPLGRIGTWLAVAAGWVLFRSPTLTDAGEYFGALAGFSSGGASAADYLNRDVVLVLLAGIVAATPVTEWFRNSQPRWKTGLATMAFAGSLLVLAGSFLALAGGAYQPFLYFRF